MNEYISAVDLIKQIEEEDWSKLSLRQLILIKQTTDKLSELQKAVMVMPYGGLPDLVGIKPSDVQAWDAEVLRGMGQHPAEIGSEAVVVLGADGRAINENHLSSPRERAAIRMGHRPEQTENGNDGPE